MKATRIVTAITNVTTISDVSNALKDLDMDSRAAGFLELDPDGVVPAKNERLTKLPEI